MWLSRFKFSRLASTPLPLTPTVSPEIGVHPSFASEDEWPLGLDPEEAEDMLKAPKRGWRVENDQVVVVVGNNVDDKAFNTEGTLPRLLPNLRQESRDCDWCCCNGGLR
ncbi:hypothetical protein TB2_034262 [Malus domestica]